MTGRPIRSPRNRRTIELTLPAHSGRRHPPLPLVRASALLPFVMFLTEIGAPVDRLLHASKIRLDACGNPEALLPLRYVCRFLDEAGRKEGIVNLGFLVGARTPITALGQFGGLIRRALTLWEALKTAEKLLATMNSGFRLCLERQDDCVWVQHDNRIRTAAGSEQADAFGLMLILHLIRLASAKSWRPAAVRLQMPPDRDVGDFEPFATASLRFRQGASAIAVPAALLSRPLEPLPERGGMPRDLSAEPLKSSAPAPELSGSVRQFLRTQLPDGHFDLKTVAEAAGLSVRTLQRQLCEEGGEYAGLLDQVRFERAAELLGHPNVKIVDVAQELGYGDAANFTRAFRRWTGISPQEFRRMGE